MSSLELWYCVDLFGSDFINKIAFENENQGKSMKLLYIRRARHQDTHSLSRFLNILHSSEETGKIFKNLHSSLDSRFLNNEKSADLQTQGRLVQ